MHSLGSTCLCRPLYKVPAGTNDQDQPTPTPLPQLSSPASNKIQKPGRRQSNMQVIPENIAKALEVMPESLKPEEEVPRHIANFPSYQMAQDKNRSTSFDDTLPGIYKSDGSVKATSKSFHGQNCCIQKPQQPPVASNGGGSCCGQKPNAPATTESLPNAEQQKTQRSTMWDGESYLRNSAPPTWQTIMDSAQSPFMQSFGMHDHQSQAVYMDDHPPGLSSASYSNMMNGLGISQSNMSSITTNSSHNHTYAPAPLSGDACHDCKCGDECQCLGCAAHPFNNTTRQHVQEMGVMMTFDGEEHSPEVVASAFQSPFHGSAATTPMNLFIPQTPSLNHGLHGNSFDQYSDPSSTMPSGYSSPLTAGYQLNQQLMHPSEYYTLEYPVGLPSACSDVTGSCQCGNDCSCVGCLTHSGHNGVSLEAPISEPSVAHTSEQQESSQRPLSATADSYTSHIPLLENVTVSCSSPRTLETSMI